MKNIKQFTLLFCCLLCALGVQAANPSDTAAVGRAKRQIAAMIVDSDKDFIFNQRSTSPDSSFEDWYRKTKYYESVTRYKGEISLLREQEKDGIVYKSLIFGWSLNANTPKDVKTEAETMRKGALALIQEKVKKGFKSYKVKTLDSSVRTELRDSLGNRIFELTENKTYLHLIVFGIKWRTATVDGLSSEFVIGNVLNNRDKKKILKLEHSYSLVGIKNDIALYAAVLHDDVIFAVDNPTNKGVTVNIKVIFECEAKGVVAEKPEETRITVPADMLKSYGKDKTTCKVTGCKSKSWKVADWSVE
jgi:hypothetical protein